MLVRLMNIIGTILIGVSCLFIIAIAYYSIKKELNTSSPIETKLVITPALNIQNDTVIKRLDSINKSIQENLNEIKKVQDNIISSKQDESLMQKIFVSLVALIFAIAGFFGYKSMSEIKVQSLEQAKEEAKKATERIFVEEFENRVFSKSLDALKTYSNKELENLNQKISRLEADIEELKKDNFPSENEPPIIENEENDPFKDA